MQQTILAMLALMIVGSFTLNQHQGVARTYNELVDDELEIAASGVATHIMELISNRAFDQRTLPAETNTKGLVVGTAELTSSSAFGTATGCDLDEPYKDTVACVDVDDAHMADGTWQDVPFHLKDGKELPFDVHVDVFYVDPSNLDQPLTAGQRSLHKKVVINVRAKRHVQQNRYSNGFVRLERIISYDTKRAENRLKEAFGTPVSGVVDPPVVDETGGDNNGGDVYDTEEQVENDPDTPVWLCHRSVKRGKITWSTKSVKQKFSAKHVGHGDKMGKCTV